MSNVLIGAVTNPDTIRGKSAYEIAVAHGFDGTEEEWLNHLTEEAVNRAIETAKEEIAKLAVELGVVQETGESETSVMSQKAVTDALACKVDKIFKHSITITDIVSADYSVHLTVQNTSATPYTDIFQLDDSESWGGTSYPVTGDCALGDNVVRIDVIAMDGVAWLVYTNGSTENMLDISNAEVTDIVAEV